MQNFLAFMQCPTCNVSGSVFSVMMFMYLRACATVKHLGISLTPDI